MNPKDMQVRLQEELQVLGYNVVTCIDCGTVIITKVKHITVCPDCFCEESNEFPDLWY